MTPRWVLTQIIRRNVNVPIRSYQTQQRFLTWHQRAWLIQQALRRREEYLTSPINSQQQSKVWNPVVLNETLSQMLNQKEGENKVTNDTNDEDDEDEDEDDKKDDTKSEGQQEWYSCSDLEKKVVIGDKVDIKTATGSVVLNMVFAGCRGDGSIRVYEYGNNPAQYHEYGQATGRPSLVTNNFVQPNVQPNNNLLLPISPIAPIAPNAPTVIPDVVKPALTIDQFQFDLTTMAKIVATRLSNQSLIMSDQKEKWLQTLKSAAHDLDNELITMYGFRNLITFLQSQNLFVNNNDPLYKNAISWEKFDDYIASLLWNMLNKGVDNVKVNLKEISGGDAKDDSKTLVKENPVVKFQERVMELVRVVTKGKTGKTRLQVAAIQSDIESSVTEIIKELKREFPGYNAFQQLGIISKDKLHRLIVNILLEPLVTELTYLISKYQVKASSDSKIKRKLLDELFGILAEYYGISFTEAQKKAKLLEFYLILKKLLEFPPLEGGRAVKKYIDKKRSGGIFTDTPEHIQLVANLESFALTNSIPLSQIQTKLQEYFLNDGITEPEYTQLLALASQSHSVVRTGGIGEGGEGSNLSNREAKTGGVRTKTTPTQEQLLHEQLNCGPDEIVRRAYTRSNGVQVRATCQKSALGRSTTTPLRKRVLPPLNPAFHKFHYQIKEGDVKTRHKALTHAVGEIGGLHVFRHLNELAIYYKNPGTKNPKQRTLYHNRILSDRNWVETTFKSEPSLWKSKSYAGTNVDLPTLVGYKNVSKKRIVERREMLRDAIKKMGGDAHSVYEAVQSLKEKHPHMSKHYDRDTDWMLSTFFREGGNEEKDSSDDDTTSDDIFGDSQLGGSLSTDDDSLLDEHDDNRNGGSQSNDTGVTIKKGFQVRNKVYPPTVLRLQWYRSPSSDTDFVEVKGPVIVLQPDDTEFINVPPYQWYNRSKRDLVIVKGPTTMLPGESPRFPGTFLSSIIGIHGIPNDLNNRLKPDQFSFKRAYLGTSDSGSIVIQNSDFGRSAGFESADDAQ